MYIGQETVLLQKQFELLTSLCLESIYLQRWAPKSTANTNIPLHQVMPSAGARIIETIHGWWKFRKRGLLCLNVILSTG